MTYTSLESSVSEGRPYFLYQFTEGTQVWRFNSRAEVWTSTGSGDPLTWEPGTLTALSRSALALPEAVLQPDGWYRGGVLRFGLQLGFTTGHAGGALTMSRPMPELAAALTAPEIDPETGDPLPMTVDLAICAR